MGISKLYFKHDYNARNDNKVLKLRIKHSWTGYGVFLALIEKLYEEGGYIEYDSESLSFELQIDQNIIESVIQDFGLFNFKDDNGKKIFYSERVLLQLNEIKSKRNYISEIRQEVGKKGAKSRWQKNSKSIANDSKSIANDSKSIANDSIDIDKDIDIDVDDKEKEINKEEEILPTQTPSLSSSPSSSFDTSPKDPYTVQSKERKVALKERKVEEPMHIPSYVRKAYNRETEEQYTDSLLNDEKFLADTAITTNVPLYKIKEYVPIFIAHCRATEASHRSSGDFKSHFINYINKKEHNGKDTKHNFSTDAEQRRGFDNLKSIDTTIYTDTGL